MTALRVCMVSTFYPPANFGGDGIQVQRLARALAARGHDVTVVHSAEGFSALGGDRHNGGPDEPGDGVKTIPVDAGIGAVSPLLTHVTGRPLATARKLQDLLDQDWDVLHFHNPSLIGGPAVLGMGSARVRLYTAHEQWLVCPTHVLWKNGREVCEKPACTRCQLSYRRPPQLWRHGKLLERSLAHLDALIVPSRTSARIHQRFGDLVRIEHIPHFAPAPGNALPHQGERPYFLFVGRLESIKGAEALLEAFRGRTTEELLIVGEGSLHSELEAAARDLPHVRFLGWRSPAELDALYRGALAAIVPTLGHESFGLVAVEAFARGTPAVVRGFGALAELAEDSGAALTFLDREELTRALDRLAGDRDLRGELGRRGVAAYERRWTEAAHIQRYLGLITELSGEVRQSDADVEPGVMVPG